MYQNRLCRIVLDKAVLLLCISLCVLNFLLPKLLLEDDKISSYCCFAHRRIHSWPELQLASNAVMCELLMLKGLSD